MAASGLNPKHRMEIGSTDEDCVCEMIEFAMAMRQKLQEVNMDAFNTFQLRVGISSGPIVSGVIGARKPIFDIWGNTGETCCVCMRENYFDDDVHFSKCCLTHGLNW